MFLSPLWGCLEATYDILTLIGERAVDFLLVLIELDGSFVGFAFQAPPTLSPPSQNPGSAIADNNQNNGSIKIILLMERYKMVYKYKMTKR